jgi:uncharacterized membrane protein
MASLRGFGTQTPFSTDWQNFQNWLNSSQGWIFYFAIFLTMLVILLFVAWLRVGRAHKPQHHSETSPQQDEGESEGK